ncbi:MAG: NucA/NucB deoxyribonuclease domain-containing protein [Hydrogenophaga sp.]|nr:NucA/NucB deoxyribonuclease domain-containing protein [Hydrogenophaga sp.]
MVISRSRCAEAARHIDDAQCQGQPSIVHIDRAGGAERRRPSTGSVDRHRKPRPLHERDEYPSALVREGGPNANVRNSRAATTAAPGLDTIRALSQISQK